MTTRNNVSDTYEYDRATKNFERDFPYLYRCVKCHDECRSKTFTDNAICPTCGEHMERIKGTIFVATGVEL